MSFNPSSRYSFRTIVIVFGILLFIILWTVVLIVVGAESIVEYIGIENGYLVMFLVSLLGGVSSVGAVAYITTIITLSNAGLDPLTLALASGAGVSIGDTVYYLLGRNGSKLIRRSRASGYIQNFTTWLNQQHMIVRSVGIFMYTAFTPLPNDILTIAMGIAQQPYGMVIASLVLGNITHTFLLGTFGSLLPF